MDRCTGEEDEASVAGWPSDGATHAKISRQRSRWRHGPRLSRRLGLCWLRQDRWRGRIGHHRGAAEGAAGLSSDCTIRAAITVAAPLISAAAMTTTPRASATYVPPLNWQGAHGCAQRHRICSIDTSRCLPARCGSARGGRAPRSERGCNYNARTVHDGSVVIGIAFISGVSKIVA